MLPRHSIVAAALGSLLACGGDSSTPGGGSGGAGASTGGGAVGGGGTGGASPSVVTVTPEDGGMVSSEDGRFVVEVPPGAVAEPTDISVARVAAEDVPEPWASDPARVYKLEPEGLEFAKPVSLSYTYPRVELESIWPSGAVPFSVLTSIDANNEQEAAADSQVQLDVAADSVTVAATTTHFSGWHSSFVVDDLGAGYTFISISNLGTATTTVTVTFYGEEGARVADQINVVSAGSVWTFATEGGFEPLVPQSSTQPMTLPIIIGKKPGAGSTTITERIEDPTLASKWHFAKAPADLTITVRWPDDLVSDRPCTDIPWMSTIYAIYTALAGQKTADAVCERAAQGYAGNLTRHSSENVAGKAPKADQDILFRNGVVLPNAGTMIASNLPCGSGKLGETYCSGGNPPFPAGDVLSVCFGVKGKIPTDTSGYQYQHSVWLRTTTGTGDDYQAQAPYTYDWWGGSDQQYALQSSAPSGPYQVTAFKGPMLTQTPSAARWLVRDNTACVFVPGAEPSQADGIPYGTTTFQHDGSYGANGNWSGDLAPWAAIFFASSSAGFTMTWGADAVP